MNCKIYFIRHGQSVGNLNETFLGHTDLDLSELGTRQAQHTADYLLTKNIDVIYSSDLMRAYNTAKAFSLKSGLNIIKNKNLREINAGRWENNTYTFLKENFKDSYKTWLDDIGNAQPDGGESVRELQMRIVNEVTKIAADNDGKTVAIFTHATPIRTFFSCISNQSIDEIKNRHWPSNCSVSLAEYSDGKFIAREYSVDVFLKCIKSFCSENV